MFGQCMRWIKRWDPRSPRPLPSPLPVGSASGAQLAPQAQPSAAVDCRGHAEGWLRVLRAGELLELTQSGKALDAMWRQSRLSDQVWRRDLLPAVHRYAEFVQLMPASENHHHAHVGGLLAHTLEMTLAAMTWRNGHFFPEGAAVEEIDAQRDEWTYVVFFAALLHDVGKIMTDLKVSWSCTDMDAPLRWVPLSGPLTEIVQQRAGGQYLVEFTPKSARDYQAHSKLAMILLQQIAPPTALSFLARRPQAFDSLVQYLIGADKSNLLATIIRKADQTSTQHALANGSRARFTTSTSVSLIDLLMQSIKEMLRSGTALPLNRSGAAGWIYDGAIWFVAKRLADSVRQHIKQRYPEEAVPGDNKNDRLFDTWQEYGCIQLNPQTGQAVWYVQVHGGQASTGAAIRPQLQDEQGDAKEEQEGGATYTHSLTMLRFPLNKLFADPAQYPPNMIGRIEVLQKRAATSTGHTTDAVAVVTDENVEASTDIDEPREVERNQPDAEAAINATTQAKAAATTQPGTSQTKGPERQREKNAPILRAPAFSRPKPAAHKPVPASVGDVQPHKDPAATSGEALSANSSAAAARPVPAATDAEPIQLGGPDGFGKWLDFDDDAAMFKAPPKTAAKPATKTNNLSQATSQKPAAKAPIEARSPRSDTPPPANAANGALAKPTRSSLPPIPEAPTKRPLLVRSGQPSFTGRSEVPAAPRMQHAPVVLTPFLPELPHESADKRAEPSGMAMAFVNWLQQGLAGRELKYNETGAMVHFTAEGMALVSPLVFKAFVADQTAVNDSEAEAQALQVQREVIKAGWHLMGPGKTNILKYQVLGRGGVPVGKLSAVVLIRPERWVMPVPPSNPVLQIAGSDRG